MAGDVDYGVHGGGYAAVRVMAAGAVVSDSQGRFLLVLRSRDPEAGCWTIPGGRAEGLESLAETAIRETYEETGLHVQIQRELGLFELSVAPGQVYEIHDFLAHSPTGELCAGDDAADVGWFSREEMAGMRLTHDLLGYLTRYGVLSD